MIKVSTISKYFAYMWLGIMIVCCASLMFIKDWSTNPYTIISGVLMGWSYLMWRIELNSAEISRLQGK